MPYDGLITSYLGSGTAAARPATPNVTPTATVWYFSTDTSTLNFYANGSWRNVPVGSGVALPDGDYGDITVSGTGTAFAIDSGAVSLAKMASVATGTVFYRKTAGTGAPEVQTLATLKTDLGLTGTNSGDQTITLTGDVTGSGTGTFAATIANDAVSYGKIQNVSAASKLLGRGDSGSGDIQEITLGTGLTMTGTTVSATGASGALLAANNLSDLASASTARTNLGLGTAAVDDRATTAQVQAGTANKVVEPDKLVASAAPQTLTDGAAITWDMSLGYNAKVTLGGNRTLAVSNPVLGMTYCLGVIQDATGSRTMTWPSSFDWGTTGAPTLTTTASKRDRITLFCTDASTPKFDAFLSGKGFS